MLSFTIVFVVALFSTYIFKKQKEFMPQNYFYYGQLLESSEDISFLGMIFRTVIPLLAGLLTGTLIILFRCPTTPENYGVLVGLFITFLVIWPSIYFPETVIEYKKKRNKLYLLRILFITLFGFLGGLGGKLSIIFFQLLEWVTKKNIYNLIDPKAIINNLLSSLIWVIIIAILIFFHKKYSKLISEKS